MKIALVLGIVAVITNIFLVLYAKRINHKAKADELSNPKDDYNINSYEYLNTPEVKRLRRSAAAELSISVEELDRMSAKEVTQLAKDQELINTG